MEPTQAIKLSVVAFQEGETWIAQCVEYDIAAHATQLTQIPAAFERVLIDNLCVNAELGRTGLDGIPPGPPIFAKMFAAWAV
jgi:glucose-6-phosphate 1-dehydrogenase